jgi:predicted protein tyrosine phosphatase
MASTPLRKASLKVGNWATVSRSTASAVPVLMASAADQAIGLEHLAADLDASGTAMRASDL